LSPGIKGHRASRLWSTRSTLHVFGGQRQERQGAKTRERRRSRCAPAFSTVGQAGISPRSSLERGGPSLALPCVAPPARVINENVAGIKVRRHPLGALGDRDRPAPEAHDTVNGRIGPQCPGLLRVSREKGFPELVSGPEEPTSDGTTRSARKSSLTLTACIAGLFAETAPSCQRSSPSEKSSR
jgi:hypothetical protein